MYNKLALLSTMSFLKERKITFIELVELVDLVEKELPSILSFQMTQSSSEKSKITTTLRLKKCLKISKTLTQAENSEQLLGEPIFYNTICPSWEWNYHRLKEFDSLIDDW